MDGLVIVPLDGSPEAEHGIHYARRIARLSEAELRLVQVHASAGPPMLSWLLMGQGRASIQTRGHRLRRVDAKYVEQLADRVAAGQTSVHVSWVVLDGPVETTLLRYVEREGADLIVMTTRGLGGLARARVGSVANRLARQAAAPVLLVPPAKHPPESYRERGFGGILIALDGSDFAEEILEPARAIGSLMNASYVLFHVLPPVDHEPARDRRDSHYPGGDTHERREAEAYLNRVADRLRRGEAEVETSVLERPEPAEAILGWAKEKGASLIALTTVGRGGIARVLLGSVADQVMREADVPVLTLNPNVPRVRGPLAAEAARRRTADLQQRPPGEGPITGERGRAASRDSARRRRPSHGARPPDERFPKRH